MAGAGPSSPSTRISSRSSPRRSPRRCPARRPAMERELARVLQRIQHQETMRAEACRCPNLALFDERQLSFILHLIERYGRFWKALDLLDPDEARELHNILEEQR